MKITNKNIIFVIVLFIGITGVFIINTPQFEGKFYLKDRITINLTVMLNEKEVPLDNLQAICVNERDENCDVVSNNGSYKTRGGDYGLYTFTITIPSNNLNESENDLTINLKFLNANAWYISKSDCVIYLNTDNKGNIVAEKAEIDVKYNDGTNNSSENKVELKNNSLEIYWGI